MALLHKLTPGSEYELPLKDGEPNYIVVYVGNVMIKIAKQEDGVSADILQRFPVEQPELIATAYSFDADAPSQKKCLAAQAKLHKH